MPDARTGPLAGRGAVVTGAGRGIGAAVAQALGGAGASVMVAARTVAEIERVAAELVERGVKAWAQRCDVGVEASVLALGEAARARLGRVDILVNNAGVSSAAPLPRLTLDEWDRTLGVLATGTFLCTREFVPGMVERGWGRVVNVASVAGLEGARYVAHYSAAKHAVIGFTRSIALELEGSGVTINAVCPGYVDTPMTEAALAHIQDRTGLPRERALTAVLASAGQERLVTPEEVADAVLALCRDDAAGSNGQAVVLEEWSGDDMTMEIINPESLGAPKGWSNGVLAPKDGRLLFIAGQTGWETEASGPRPGFPDQFARALDKVLAVVNAAAGKPTDIARLTVYVTDLTAYRASLGSLGEAWRARFGKYYPAMALVEVKGLAERGALVEIEATAVIGGSQ